MLITMPDGSESTIDDIKESLKGNGIEISEPNKEVTDYLVGYYDSHLQQKIYANRYEDTDNLEAYFGTKLSDILNVGFLEKHIPDIVESTKVLLKHLGTDKKVLLIVDYDVDGITSGAIGYKFISKIFKHKNLEVMVNRRPDGNGINNQIVDNVKNMAKHGPISLIITSDHGSHDRVNLGIIKEETGADVIVTDHHLFTEEEAPYNMDAFINPQRYSDTVFKDMTGTGIVYLTLLHAYLKLRNKEVADESYIYYLLTYVGLTIISDCMDLKNYVNRKFVIKALIDINSDTIEHDVFWKHIKKINSKVCVIDEVTLGYDVIPTLNTPGRISDPRYSFEYLIADDEAIISQLHENIISLNTERKDKQKKLVTSGKKEEYSNGIVKVLVIEESDGIQGIIANNVMYDQNFKVVICFTKQRRKGEDLFVGSGRAQDDALNINDILTDISEKSDIILNHGGHAKAIGIKIKPDLKKFFNLLKDEIDLHKVTKKKIQYVEDYIFSTKKLLLNIFDILEVGPYGIGFEQPKFASDFIIDSYRVYTRSGMLLSFKVKFNDRTHSVFNCFYNIKDKDRDNVMELLKTTKAITMVYSINVNTYRNFNKILLHPTKLVFKTTDGDVVV